MEIPGSTGVEVADNFKRLGTIPVFGPYVHQIDPVLGTLGGVYLWWYGLSYTLGFLQILWWLRRYRERLALSLSESYTLTLFLCVGVLLGGRFIEVAFDEWAFYRNHLQLIPRWQVGWQPIALLEPQRARRLRLAYRKLPEPADEP
jgi:hypothetical protein